jgi:hypothetical protein
MLGYVAPKLDYLGIIWTFVMFADFPISLLSYVVAWRHEVIAQVWIVVAGTWWWYAISNLIIRLLIRYIGPAKQEPGTGAQR